MAVCCTHVRSRVKKPLLTSIHDSCGISLYSVTPESNIKVVTEKEDYQLKKLLIVKQILLVSII